MGEVVLLFVVILVLAALTLAMYLPDRLIPGLFAGVAMLDVFGWF
jgi:hypothetical protein